ncbi:transposase [Leptospira interrogans serovar Manilae]|uniref:Transposase n=1 Tax=Leptospira interrogans serovar Manilae TaxID=214675 RepID=A0AAQ1NXP3_LEPIR|nr:transposase [Leptospira interrogans serovar Manilae]
MRYIPPMFDSKSTLHRRFQKWIAAEVFDKIEKEILKLYERSSKIKTRRMAVMQGLQKELSRGQTRRIAAKEAYRGVSTCIFSFVIDSVGIYDSKLLFPNLT